MPKWVQAKRNPQLAAVPVAVAAVGDIAVEPFCAALRALHVVLAEPARLVVMLTDDYLRDGLRRRNEQALADGRPWLLVKPIGSTLWVGPLFRPQKTGCWMCLAQRLRENQPAAAYVRAKSGRIDGPQISRAATAATLQIAWNLAASEVACLLAKRGRSVREREILTFDLLSRTTQVHTFLRRPQCPLCGDARAARRFALPIKLQYREKPVSHGGSRRNAELESTLARYGRHLSPITGAVTRLEPIAADTDGVVHVYSSDHALAAPQMTLSGLRGELRKGCGGKGTSDLQAQVSGLCEALERYSAQFTGAEPRRRASFTELGEAAIHPNRCALFSERQYEERDRWNARRAYYCLVPPPLDPQAEIDWSPLWSLSRGKVRYLPTSLCYLGASADDLQADCGLSSNGCAAGNTLEEAILQGSLELVERDGCALWWYNRVRRPAVDLSSFNDPYLSQLATFLAAQNRSLWALDLTTDLEVPIFAAVSHKTDGGSEHILLGFGAHLDARIALLRAAAELAQMLTWVRTGKDKEQIRDELMAPITADWLRSATTANQPYLCPDPAVAPRRRADFPLYSSVDFREDIRCLQSRFECAGLEMLVLDLTRPDIGLKVAKVVVPGLRPHWARFAPGRLYDVPVKRGWLPKPIPEEALNPIPMFL